MNVKFFLTFNSIFVSNNLLILELESKLYQKVLHLEYHHQTLYKVQIGNLLMILVNSGLKIGNPQTLMKLSMEN